MPSTSSISGYRAFLWSGEDASGGAGERDNEDKGGKGERSVRVGSVIAKQGGRGGYDREGGSDSASSEAKGIQVYDSMEIKEFNKFIDDMN